MSRLKLVLITLGIVAALALALVLKLLVFAPKHGEPDWTLSMEPQKPLLVAAPGEFVTQIFSLMYNEPASETAVLRASFTLSLKAPDDWQMLGLDEVNPIALAPGESRQVFVTIGIPSRTPPGDYDLTLRPVLFKLEPIETQSTRATFRQVLLPTVAFTVRVKRATIPKVEPRFPRAEAEAGSKVELHFILSNLGNAQGTVKLMSIAPPGWRMELDQRRIELDVSESREVGITVSVPADAPSGVEKVTLRAQAGGYESEAAIKVTVLPR